MSIPGRDERGQSLSALVAVVLIALFLVTGLVVDGGRQVAAARAAEAGAAQAARAASDHGATARASGVAPDLVAIRAAGQHVLQQRMLSGSVTVAGGEVRVTARATSPTVFLAVLGITTVSGTGEATAVLLT